MNQIEVNIAGPCSNFKTETAQGVAEYLGQNGVPTVWYSRGSFFRYVTEMLQERGIEPESLSQANLDDVIGTIYTTVIDGELRPLTPKHTPINHSFENGDIASLYATREIFQEGMRNFLNSIKEKYSNYKVFIEEGREPADEDGLTFVLTTNLQTSVDIKRIEYEKETKDLSNGQIQQAISTRNRRDKGLFTVLFQRKNVYYIPRRDASEKNHKKIVETIGRIVIMKDEGEQLPQHGIIFP